MSGQPSIDLSSATGLVASLDLETGILFGDHIVSEPPATRTRQEMQPYLMDPKVTAGVQYRMIRDVHLAADEAEFHRRNLRFDLTILSAERLGKEYSKTVGHYHPVKPGTDLTYPELYSIVSGSGLFLLQKESRQHRVTEAVIEEAVAGQYLVIPPGFGHSTINCGPDPLVLANWVARNFVSDYHEYREHHGGAYYLTVGSNRPQVVADPSYRHVAPVVWARPLEAIPQLHFYEPIYTSLHHQLDRLQFLTHPEGESSIFAKAFVSKNERR